MDRTTSIGWRDRARLNKKAIAAISTGEAIAEKEYPEQKKTNGNKRQDKNRDQPVLRAQGNEQPVNKI